MLDGSCLFEQRHWPEAGSRYLRVHCLPQTAQCWHAMTSPNLSTHSRIRSQTMQTSTNSTTSHADNCQKIAVVDGMVLVQKLSKKAPAVVTVKDLSVRFNDKLMNLTRHFDEVIVVFDTHRAYSLKNKTRQKRRKGKDAVQYQVRDETSIRHITLNWFL